MIDSLEPRASDRNKQLLYKIAGLLFGNLGGGTPPDPWEDVLFHRSFTEYVPDGLVDATFSRASVATYVDRDRIVQTAASGIPRTGHYANGSQTLLLEGSRTNLCLQSTNLASGVPWSLNSSGAGAVLPVVVANAGVAPDGTTTAAQITVNCDTAGLNSSVFQNLTTTTDATYTASCWFKAFAAGDVGKRIQLVVTGAPPVNGAVTVTLTASWQRVSVTSLRTTFTQFVVGNFSAVDLGPISFFAWGAQMELGPAASSDIYTTTAAVTREADFLSFPYTELPQEMTVFVRGHFLGSDVSTVNHFFVVGGSNPGITEYVIGVTWLSRYYSNSATNRDAVVNAQPNLGDVFEFRNTLTSAGEGQIGVAINGGVEAVGAPAAAETLPPNWMTQTLLVNSETAGRGFFGFRDIFIAKGVKDLNYFRSLIYEANQQLILRWELNAGTGGFIVPDRAGVNGSTNATWVTGKSGYGLSFDGTTQYLSTIGGMWYGYVNVLTVCAWIWCDALDFTGGLFETGDGLSNPNAFTIYLAGAQIIVRSIGNPGQRETIFPFNVTGAWAHVAVVMSPTYNRLFVNGVPQAQTSETSNRMGSDNFGGLQLHVGSRTKTGLFFKGKMDDIRIYSGDQGSALSAIMADPQ